MCFPFRFHLLLETDFLSCVNQLFVTVRKYLRHAILKEKRFILVHGFAGYSAPSVAPVALGLSWGRTSWQECSVEQAAHFMTTGEQGERRDQSSIIPCEDTPPMT
jgi:hypothetical protein